ncbi:hypothetical protein T492DRAFT_958621 [Pavlovales sp. CCMP2436]|nr:hypothetical protein T492DRAFT_958621 [Pavlovales sp. CCMP2436]
MSLAEEGGDPPPANLSSWLRSSWQSARHAPSAASAQPAKPALAELSTEGAQSFAVSGPAGEGTAPATPTKVASGAPAASTGGPAAEVPAAEEEEEEEGGFGSPSSTALAGGGFSGGADEEQNDELVSDEEAEEQTSARRPRGRLDDTLAGCMLKFCRTDLAWFSYWLCVQLPAHVGKALWRSESVLVELGGQATRLPKAQRERLRRRFGWWRLLAPVCRVEWALPPAPASPVWSGKQEGTHHRNNHNNHNGHGARNRHSSDDDGARGLRMLVGEGADEGGKRLLTADVARSDAAGGGGAADGGGHGALSAKGGRAAGGRRWRARVFRLLPGCCLAEEERLVPCRLVLVWWRWACLKVCLPLALLSAATWLCATGSAGQAGMLWAAKGAGAGLFVLELTAFAAWGANADASRWARAVQPHHDLTAADDQRLLWSASFRAMGRQVWAGALVLALAFCVLILFGRSGTWPGAYLAVPLLLVLGSNIVCLSPWSPVSSLRALLYGSHLAQHIPSLAAGLRASALPQAVRGQLPPRHYIAWLRLFTIVYDGAAWSALALTPANPVTPAVDARLVSALNAASLLTLPQVDYRYVFAALAICLQFMAPVALVCDAAGHRLTAIFVAELCTETLALGITRNLFKARALSTRCTLHSKHATV